MLPSHNIPQSFLDILFANRNKAYGAYALRINYANRLWLSLGISLLLAGLLTLASFLWKPADTEEKILVIPVTTCPGPVVVLPPPPLPLSAPPKTQGAAATPAQEKYNTIKIVPDHLSDKTIVDIASLADKQPGNFSSPGEPANGQPVIGNDTGGETPVAAAAPVAKPFIPDQQEPEFPGGQTALVRFLQKYLIIPDQLEAGEKKMVRARFMVDAQGVVSLVEITETAGNVFDREVIRVCKKMPRWKPAIQNGVPVSRSYVLPVTFVDVEQ